MDHLPPVDSLSDEELAAHLRTQHAVVPRDIEDRERMLEAHMGGRLAGHAHDLPAAPAAAESAWRGTVRLVGVPEGADGPPFMVVELEDAAGVPPVGSVVTVLPGDGLRG